MLDRSQATNLFSEHAQEADELAGAADAAVERPAASPDVDSAQAQRDASPSATASPRARPRRPRPSGGGRRGTARPTRPVAARGPVLSFPGVPLRLPGWARRARLFLPAALLLLLILVIDPAGCGRQVTHTGTPASLVPAVSPLRTHSPAGGQRVKRAAPPCLVPRTHPLVPAPAVSTAPASVRAQRGDGAPAPAVPAAAPVAPTAASPEQAVPVPVSSPAAPDSGSPPPDEEAGEEFGFER